MPKIPDDVVKRITDLARIEDVVGDFVTLRKAGVNLTGLCPFHDDKHDGNFIVRPSTVSAKRGANTYRCFVCDKKGGPVTFLMEHERLSFPDAIRWLGKKYNEPVDDVPLNYTPPPPRPAPPPLPDLEIPRAYVSRTMELAGDKTIFIYWLRHLPWDADQKARLVTTLWQYCVGGWRDGRVVFWQIDHNGIPRAAKLMKYLEDGHRDKTVHPGWIYNQDGVRQRLNPDGHNIMKPLFGSHLLAKYPKAVVNIVESEKTAIIMANYYGDFDSQIWMACGGLKHLQLDSIQPLIDQGRTIWLWPDKDGADDWQTVADKLGYDRCHVYTRFFATCWRETDGQKADIADIAIRMMRTGEGPRKEKEQRFKDLKDFPAQAQSSKSSNLCIAWDTDEPFLDPDELSDPRVREWRERMSHVHSAGWGSWPKSRVADVKTVGEVLAEHPLLSKLL